MKWYNLETWFRSVRDAVQDYLNSNEIAYEISQLNYFCGWHFEIYCDRDTANAINSFFG